MSFTPSIVGRYAPSPTGDLHLGNLRTALLSWLHARLQDGRFILRIEDIDMPRTVEGSADRILRDLEWLGMDWDGEVVYQSKRLNLYRDALSSLQQKSLIYPCFCSRRDIRDAASAPNGGPGHKGGEVIYPGTCRNLDAVQQEQQHQLKAPAYRMRTHGQLARDCGDFILKRSDQLYAYQLAVVVDDLDQGVTHVVRGADLATSTARQQYLARQLNPSAVQIEYWHAPLMLDESGSRMAKRDGSTSIRAWQTDHRGEAQELIAFLLGSLNLTEQSALSLDEALGCCSLDSVQSALEFTKA